MTETPPRDCWCCRRYGVSRPATTPDGLCDGCAENCRYDEEGSRL